MVRAPAVTLRLSTRVFAAGRATGARFPQTAHSPGLAIATLIAWLIAGTAGLYMFGTWLRSGGPQDQRSRRDGLPPVVIFTHLSLGGLGLLVWVGFLATGWPALAWSAVGLLMPGIGLGICTVTLWGPYPAPPLPPQPGSAGALRPGDTGTVTGMLAAPADDLLSRRLTDEAITGALTNEALTSKLVNDMLAGLTAPVPPPARKSRRHMAPLIPAAHGIAAVATFVLAVVAAIGAT
jgi:hypothetical protein